MDDTRTAAGDAAHQELLEALQDTDPDVRAGAMFGMPTLVLGRKAFAGRYGDDLNVKLTGSEHAAAMAVDGAHQFDPMGGRPMKQWVVLPLVSSATWEEFARAALRDLRDSL